jgi:hypothetical protein
MKSMKKHEGHEGRATANTEATEATEGATATALEGSWRVEISPPSQQSSSFSALFLQPVMSFPSAI